MNNYATEKFNTTESHSVRNGGKYKIITLQLMISRILNMFKFKRKILYYGLSIYGQSIQ